MFRFSLRMPDELHEDVKKAAELADHSLHAELLERLETSFHAQHDAGGPHQFMLREIWTAHFRHGARLGALAFGVDPNDLDEALRHPFVFRTAVHAAAEGMLATRPTEWEGEDLTPERIDELNRQLEVATRLVARGLWPRPEKNK